MAQVFVVPALFASQIAAAEAETAIGMMFLGPSKQILASENVSDLLPHIRGGGADIDGSVRWGLLR